MVVTYLPVQMINLITALNTPAETSLNHKTQVDILFALHFENVHLQRDKISTHTGYDQEAPESSTSPDPTTWSERTIKMHSFLDKLFVNNSEISYMGMVKEKDRKLVVGTFFEVLVLKTKDIIEVDQSKAYGDIKITKTVRGICRQSTMSTVWCYEVYSCRPGKFQQSQSCRLK